MKFYWIFIAMTTAMIIVIIMLINHVESTTVTVQYDCGMLIGGWHPDVPPEVQQQCRKKLKGN
jgi:hypothetical protein